MWHGSNRRGCVKATDGKTENFASQRPYLVGGSKVRANPVHCERARRYPLATKLLPHTHLAQAFAVYPYVRS